eukprot:1159231-Pelagomonas_calceolata.AAC.3
MRAACQELQGRHACSVEELGGPGDGAIRKVDGGVWSAFTQHLHFNRAYYQMADLSLRTHQTNATKVAGSKPGFQTSSVARA